MNKKHIGAYELRIRISEILRRVSEGEAFTITKRGKPVADLLPNESAIRRRTVDAVAKIRRMKKPEPISDALLKKYIEKGRAGGSSF